MKTLEVFFLSICMILTYKQKKIYINFSTGTIKTEIYFTFLEMIFFKILLYIGLWDA